MAGAGAAYMQDGEGPVLRNRVNKAKLGATTHDYSVSIDFKIDVSTPSDADERQGT